ncbi:hypothetical protein DPMN_071078 [Dreissena polymorpha]|uniref:Uncharacterized protein n=1 Tax=Dreissena polymorpha TaxID=45954 RepID=A0A9D4BVZ1_DREPO|nr:hypothetical protein DPMN_071078 [Dreissena polymorpha]
MNNSKIPGSLWGSFTTTTAITSNDKILNYSHGHQLECSSGWHQSSSSSSRELVGYTRRLGGWTLVGYGSSTSQIALYIYFWEYTSREMRVIDTITGNSQTHIHIYFWEYTSREMRVIDTITGNSQTHIHSRRDRDSNGTMIPLTQAQEWQRIAGYIQTAAF